MRPLPGSLASILVAACSFSGGNLQPGGSDGGGAADAQVPADARPADARLDAPPPFCDRSDATLAACYAFEGNADDGSQHGNDALAISVDYGSPGIDGLAVHLTSGSKVFAPDSASLNPTAAVTLEAWIKPYAVPQSANGRAYVVAKGKQYALFLGQKGQLGCETSNGSVSGGVNVPTNQWTHVACVYDQNAPIIGSSLILYEGGVAVATSPAKNALDMSNDPLEIGAASPCGGGTCASTFDGLIDDVRVWSVVRTGTQICKAAHLC